MAYLEISTGYQFYIKFIESSCSFVQAHADTFASDVLSNSNLSKEKGIYCLVIHNTRVSGSNSSAAYSLATAFGSQVPADVATAIKNTLPVSLQSPQNFSQALIQVYKLIPKQKTTYYYYIKAVSQARVEAWPGNHNSHSPISPSYGPLTGDIRHEIKKETNTTGNAIDAHYFIVDASGDNMQYIQNIEYELKEEYVAFSSQKVAMLYGEKFGHWMLVGWNYSNNQGANSPVDINYRPNVSSCHFTLSKPCSEVLIDNIILVADLVAIPFGLPAIVPVGTAAIIYYGSTGQWDQAGIYLGAYLLPPAVSRAVKEIGQATRTFIRFSTNSVVSVLSKDLRIAWEIRGMVSRGLSEQGMQTLLAKQLNPTTCVEYIIPHETYKNLWVKVSQQEAMTGSFELVNGETKLIVRGYSTGKNYNVSSLEERSVRDIAEEALGGTGAATAGRQNWNGFTNIFKASTDEVLEATNRIKNYRTINNLAGGNYGYIEGVVNNSVINNKFWRSTSLEVAKDEIHIFQAIEVEGVTGNAWLRVTDSEYRMLNKFADDLGAIKGGKYPNIIGELKIISENPYCVSCTGVIQQFNEMFPNIRLILVDGAK